MGWTFTQGSTRSDIIYHLTKTDENEKRRWETLCHSVRNNVLWSVVEITYHNTQEPPKRFIACYLLKAGGTDGWGYKDMEESMYPYYFTCPLKYLSMVPETCAEWREGVREFHRIRNRKVKIGQKIRILDSIVPWVNIISVAPLLGEYHGVRYRVPRKLMGEVLDEHIQ